MTLADFLNRCSFARLSSELLQSCNPFKCGNEDLDEFFREDFRLYGEKLLGKTYVFRLRERPESIVAAFTISNDSIRIKQLAPEDKAKIKQVILMGGTLSRGNMSSVAEFNVYSDPQAAEILFKSGLDLVMVGLDVTLKGRITEASQQAIDCRDSATAMG